jgi:hypothetical protein
MAGFYAVYHGPEGLRRIAQRVYRLTAILAAGLERKGVQRINRHFFDTLTLDVGGAQTAIIESATALAVPVTYELWLRDTTGLTEAQVTALVSAALTSTLSEAPIGGERIDLEDSAGYVFVDTLEAAIDDALPVGSILKRTLTLPAADVVVPASKAPVAGTITPTAVHFVSRRAA